MIRYALACDRGHGFDAWFGSSLSYDEQAEAHAITCPACGSAAVRKAPMAPNIVRGLPAPKALVPEALVSEAPVSGFPVPDAPASEAEVPAPAAGRATKPATLPMTASPSARCRRSPRTRISLHICAADFIPPRRGEGQARRSVKYARRAKTLVPSSGKDTAPCRRWPNSTY